MKDLKSGKIKDTKKAVEILGVRPLPKNPEERKLTQLAISLACTYLLAEEQGAIGEQAVGRVNNFIAGLTDKSLDKKKGKAKKKKK
ncbi:MAG: hypothetical protein QGF09_12560 [Rhodospirillales bacterium]|nr:hypothetical protein [Rhodospirillales bacterium]